jgi:threonine synthase
VAALARLRDGRLLAADDQVVVLVTGHGLKDVDAALRGVEMPAAIPPTARGLDSVAERLAEKGVPA